jgi:hypothetical protein
MVCNNPDQYRVVALETKKLSGTCYSKDPTNSSADILVLVTRIYLHHLEEQQ